MKKKNSDFDIISKSLHEIYIKGNKLKFVEQVNCKWIYHNNKGSTNFPIYEFGIKHEVINKQNYFKVHKHYIDSQKYFIKFIDSSYISIYYKFNNKKELIDSELNYVSFDIDNRDLSFSKYIRFDYDLQGYKKNVHAKSHVHITIYKNNIRIPSNRVFTPIEFLIFILLYVYHSDDEKFNLFHFKDKLSVITLDNEELNRFKIC